MVRRHVRLVLSYGLTRLHSHVPVIATGFEDLQKRVEAQTQQAAEQQQKIKVGAPSLL